MATKTDDPYHTVRLPAVLVDQIDEFVNRNRWGYRSKAEVVAAAVREFLQRHGPQPPV